MCSTIATIVIALTFSMLRAQTIDYGTLKSTVRASVNFRPRRDLPQFNIKLHQSDNDQWLSYFRVGSPKKKLYLDINCFESLGGPSDGDISEVIEFGDYNFDGYIDFAIESFRGATGNNGYMYFFYHPENSTFKLHPEWGELSWAVFIPRTKMIKTHWNNGNAGGDRSEGVYRVEGYNLILVNMKVFENNKLISNNVFH